jgi:hypothetical protein
MVSQPATVVIYDSKEEIAAIEIAGFYTVIDGTKERSDEEFWRK